MGALTIRKDLANIVTLVGRRNIYGGDQYLFDCGNGYGASVVKHYLSYGGDRGKWELAVLRIDQENPEKSRMDYDNDITRGDVLGYLSEEEVMDNLQRIANL